MRKHIALIAIVVLIVGGAAFAEEKPAMDLPVYPGGEATMEVNLGNEDILPMLKAMLPMFSGKLGKIGDKINPEDLAAALRDVKQIELLQVDVAKPEVTENDVAGFYAKSLPAGNWTRIFWQSLPQTGIVAIYSQSGGDGLYGFRVQSVSVDSKPVRRAHVLKTQGKIDYVKLLEMAGKLMARPTS
ncbi:MAG: hypothetical protein M1133_13725 [Armatimonadetes bacterium]|nr:hypothetical protein [Armatimonadota bacterium]